MIEVRREVRPAWPFRLPGTGGMDAVMRRRGGVLERLLHVGDEPVVIRAALDAVLVVDGVFAFRPEIDDYWDFRIWLDVDAETSVERGVARDRSWAGSDAETVHRDRYLASERIYLAEVDPLRMVDVVIDNSSFDRPRIVSE